MDLRDLHKIYVRRRFHPECRLEGFAAQEIELIERYGSWLEALMNETIQPFTEDQKRFVAMCKGERKAESMFEVIWRKYRLEVLCNEALRMEQLISSGHMDYAPVRAKFERLAKLGHQRAAEWLKKEGTWNPTSDATGSQTAISNIYDYVYPLSKQVSGSYGGKLDWKGIGPKPW